MVGSHLGDAEIVPFWVVDWVESAWFWEGRIDAAAGQLCRGGIRRQEEADAARQISGGDGRGGAVVAAGGAPGPALSQGRTWPAAGLAGTHAAGLFCAAMVWVG